PDGVGPAPDFAAIMPRQVGKPLASGLLGLGKGQDVRPVGIGYVIGRADRVIPAPVLSAVAARDPRAALDPLPVSYGQSERNSAPDLLAPLPKPQAGRACVELCVAKRPCHFAAPWVVRQTYGIHVAGRGQIGKDGNPLHSGIYSTWLDGNGCH